MIAPFSAVDAALYEETLGVLSTCKPQPNKRRVINVKRIAACVAMFPFPFHDNTFYAGEKPGLDMTTLQGYMEPDNEGKEDEDT